MRCIFFRLYKQKIRLHVRLIKSIEIVDNNTKSNKNYHGISRHWQNVYNYRINRGNIGIYYKKE